MAPKKPTDPAELTLAELRTRASKLEIAGRSSMKKDELVKAVVSAEKKAAPPAKKTPAKAPSATSSAATPAAASNGAASAEKGEVISDASDISAPSIGPHTEITFESSEDRLARHDQSDVDAMGLDKRRAVVGGSYSASFAKQATLYGIALAVVVGIVFGGKKLADKLDEPPAQVEVQAPWASPEAAQEPPLPIDFPANGDS